MRSWSFSPPYKRLDGPDARDNSRGPGTCPLAGKGPVSKAADAGGCRATPDTLHDRVLLGIGETPEDRDDSLRAIAAVHERFGHIQEVIIQNFCPKPGTQMAAASPVNQDEICTTVQHAREILPPEIAVQVPPNLLDASRIVPCGADDLGGVSPVTVDI